LTLDPRNVEALIGLANVNGALAATFVADNREERLTSAETALIKALSIAPDHAGAHVLMGVVQVYTNRVAQGIAQCERALALDPNLADAHAVIGLAKIVIGRSAATATLVIAGQLIGALTVDRMGLFEFAFRGLSAGRLVGVALVFVGAMLARLT
jgi:hypothetical protein